MAISAKLILAAALGGAALLGGCATGPYYDNYGYNGYYGNGYGPGYGYAYDPYYVAPSVGLGFGYTYSDGDYYRGGRYRDRDGNWRSAASTTANGAAAPTPRATRRTCATTTAPRSGRRATPIAAPARTTIRPRTTGNIRQVEQVGPG
jgi:hypothetical protein